MALIEILRHPQIGWETVAECEHCVERFLELRGCYECNYQGWRQLTEDEEIENENGHNQADAKYCETNLAGSDQDRGKQSDQKSDFAPDLKPVQRHSA